MPVFLMRVQWEYDLVFTGKGWCIQSKNATNGISTFPNEDSIPNQCACIRCTNYFSSTGIWDKALNQHEFSVFCTGD